jgi:hypothetical protein
MSTIMDFLRGSNEHFKATGADTNLLDNLGIDLGMQCRKKKATTPDVIGFSIGVTRKTLIGYMSLI